MYVSSALAYSSPEDNSDFASLPWWSVYERFVQFSVVGREPYHNVDK